MTASPVLWQPAGVFRGAFAALEPQADATSQTVGPDLRGGPSDPCPSAGHGTCHGSSMGEPHQGWCHRTPMSRGRASTACGIVP
jgi:hypothetical protein